MTQQIKCLYNYSMKTTGRYAATHEKYGKFTSPLNFS